MIQTYFEKLWEIRRRRAAGEELGFTLIELLIVIVVLGILAATVIFALSGVTSSSAVAACNSDAKSVEVAVEAYHSQQSAWPAAATDATTASAAGLTPTYLRQWPSNSGHYSIQTDGSGNVFVTPNGGKQENYDTAGCAGVS